MCRRTRGFVVAIRWLSSLHANALVDSTGKVFSLSCSRIVEASPGVAGLAFAERFEVAPLRLGTASDCRLAPVFTSSTVS